MNENIDKAGTIDPEYPRDDPGETRGPYLREIMADPPFHFLLGLASRTSK
jgi:hypothetical protein